MCRLWVAIDKYHDLRHVIETTSKRKRSYATSEDRTVGDIAMEDCIRLQIFTNPSTVKGRNLKAANIVRVVEHVPRNGWNLIVWEEHISTKRLCLHGEIHNH